MSSTFGSQYCCCRVKDANQVCSRPVKEMTEKSINAVMERAIATAAILKDLVISVRWYGRSWQGEIVAPRGALRVWKSRRACAGCEDAASKHVRGYGGVCDA